MLLGFKPRFVEPIQKGSKVFTLRTARKHEPKIGETLYMYTGLRTANCMLISNKEKLISKQRVRIVIYADYVEVSVNIWVDGRELTQAEKELFYGYDGFVDIHDFVNYWIESSTGKKRKINKRYEVGGFLTMYHWTDLKF